jgi:hypothetical protein
VEYSVHFGCYYRAQLHSLQVHQHGRDAQQWLDYRCVSLWRSDRFTYTSSGSSNGDAINMVDSTGKSIVSTSLAGGNIAITHI